MAEPPHASPHPPAEPPLPALLSCGANRQLHKTLATTANLTSLLPTSTVLTFQALTPLFSNNGACNRSNQFLTFCLIGICGIICFISSFTDSFTSENGELYYGIATFEGLYIFNGEEGDGKSMKELAKFKICCIDFVHASLSLFLFLVFALSDSMVQNCFFHELRAGENALVHNLPLGVGVLSSLLFMIFPTRRRGIGCAGVAPWHIDVAL